MELKRISQIRGKGGVSVVIGYVLLITAAIGMSILVFNWLKSYVPGESISCPSGVSLFIEEQVYTCLPNNELTLTMKNNGRFNIGGYFIRASTDASADIAITDISEYYSCVGDGCAQFGEGAVILSSIEENPFGVGDSRQYLFNLEDDSPQIRFIEIVPLRYEKIDGKTRLVSCASAEIKVEVNACP